MRKVLLFANTYGVKRDNMNGVELSFKRFTKTPSILRIAYHLRKNNIETKQIHNFVSFDDDELEEIIKIIIDNYDDYVELIKRFYLYSKSIQSVNDNKECILNMLFSYLPVDENNMCSICLITEPKTQLFNPCSCKNPIHIDCLIKTLNTLPLKIGNESDSK